MPQVNIHQAKTHLSRLVEKAAQGEDTARIKQLTEQLQQASELAKVQKKLGCPRAALGSFSEAATVFDPERLKEIVADTVERMPRDLFPDDIEVGMGFRMRNDSGQVMTVYAETIGNPQLDVLDFEQALTISPWWIYFLGGYHRSFFTFQPSCEFFFAHFWQEFVIFGV